MLEPHAHTRDGDPELLSKSMQVARPIMVRVRSESGLQRTPKLLRDRLWSRPRSLVSLSRAVFLCSSSVGACACACSAFAFAMRSLLSPSAIFTLSPGAPFSSRIRANLLHFPPPPLLLLTGTPTLTQTLALTLQGKGACAWHMHIGGQNGIGRKEGPGRLRTLFAAAFAFGAVTHAYRAPVPPT